MPDFNNLQRLADKVNSTPTEQTTSNLYPRLSSNDLNFSGRYPSFRLGLDNEDIYGRNQSGGQQILNGVIKGLGTAGSTFLSGTVGLVNGVYQWAEDGKFSSFYDNEMTRGLDQMSQNMENSLANYETRKERDAKWYSTDTWLTPNFWGNTIIKNAGFAVGALASGGAWGKIGSMIGNVSRGLATGLGAEIGANSSLETALLARQAGSIEQLSAQSANLANRTATFARIKDVGSNAVRAGLATFGEASIEALQAKNQYKDFLTREYQDKFGALPEGQDLLSIDQEADKVGDVTMKSNIALLTATNYIQFPKIMGATWKAERNALSQGIGRIALRSEAGEVIETGSAAAFRQGVQYGAVTPSRLTRLAKGAYKNAGAVFAGSEAFEEAAQYAIPIAAQDYFDKGRNGQIQDGVESLRKGVDDLFNSKQGWISILSGGISGGLMKSFSPFSNENIVRRFKNRGMEAARTADFVDRLNGTMMGSGYMNQAIQSLNRSEALSAEAEVALRNNNRLQYEDTRADQILNYMLPRIQYGRLDLIQDDLMGMRSVASSAEGYADLIKNGYVDENVESQDFIKNIDRLMNLSSSIHSNFEVLNERYGSVMEVAEDGKRYRKYNEDVIGKMAYVAAKINDYNSRIPSLLRPFNGLDLNVTELMARVHAGGIGVEGGLTNEEFDGLMQQIEDLRGISPDLKDELKENAVDLVEISSRREFKIREYEQMRDNPSEWEDEAEAYRFSQPGQPDMSRVNFNEAEPEDMPGDHRAVYDMVVDQTEGRELTPEQRDLREKYANLYEQLTATVDQSWEQSRREQASREGWYQDSEGNPVEPTSKSTFFDTNQGDYTMTLNGVDRQGVLGYDPNSNSLFFEYTDNGEQKQVEVFNEDFNDGLINRESGTIDTGYLSEEDTAAPNRVQVRVGTLISEVAARQTQVEREIKNQLSELLNITDTIKSEEKDAREFTADYVDTMSTLSDMQREVEDRYTELIQERDELNNVSAELSGLLQNVPLTLQSSIDLMERQQTDLESLAAHNGFLIPALNNLANSAKEMLNRLGKKLISRMASMVGIPPSPNMNRVRDTFARWEQSGTDQDLQNAVTALQQEYSRIQNFEVKALPESDVRWLNEKIAQAQEQMKGIDARVKAKGAVAERLKGLQEQVQEREEIVRETPAIPEVNVTESLPNEINVAENLEELKKTEEGFKDIRSKELEFEGKTPQEAQQQAQTEWAGSQEGIRTEQLQATVNAPEMFGEDSDRTPISRYFNATSLLPKNMRNKSYDRRMNIFLNKIGIFDRDRRPNLRLVAVTRANEAELGLSGFVDKYFQVRDSFDKASNVVVGDQSAVDAPIGMVVVEMVDGNIVFLDETGARIPEGTANLIDKILLTKMKAASLTWSTGETAYSDPTNLGENFANTKREEFEEQRQKVLSSEAPQLFTFRTSQGRQRESSATESPDIVGNIITDEVMKQKRPVLEVIRPDAGKSTKVVPGIIEGETVQVKPGTILLRTEDTLQKVYTRKLSQEERDRVKSALMYIVQNRETQGETFIKVRTYLEGSTFLKFGANAETLTIGPSKFNLTSNTVKGDLYEPNKVYGSSFQQLASTLGLENILGKQNTNVREGLMKQNKSFSEFKGLENGVPQFQEWPTYQEFILSTEGGRNPLVYAPIMVDKYLVFSPEKSADDVVIKPATAPEVVADRQVTTANVPKDPATINNQTDLIKAITNYFTQANEEGLSIEEKEQEKEKAKAAAAVILRMATVMADRGKFDTVAEVYKSLNFTNLLSKLNAGALQQAAPIQGIKAGDTYTDRNGVKRVWGQDIEADKSYEIYRVLGLFGEAGNIAGARSSAERLAKGEEIIFRKPEAVKVAQSNEYYNVEVRPDGSALVIGALNPDTMQWQGIPKNVEPVETATRYEAPDQLKGAISMIEGSQAIIYAATGVADISTVLHEVAHFFEANGLTDEERQTLEREASESLSKESASATEVSEFFARGFERYLRDETAPEGQQITQTTDVRGQASKLSDIFKKVRQFLVEIYDTVFGSAIDIKLSQPMKQMYQNMLGIGFAEREVKRKNLNKDVFPKSLVGESFSPTLESKDFVTGRNYKILGANSGSITSVTVKVGDQIIPVPRGQVAVRDSITKEIKVVDIPSLLSQLSDSKTDQVVKRERQARKEKVASVIETLEEFEEIDAPLPPSEIVAVVAPLEERASLTSESPAPKPAPKPTKVKAPAASVDGLKTFAGPEDVNGGIFLKDREAVYILPYFGSFVQVDEDTYKSYQKTSPSKASTVITKSRTLGNVKVGSSVTLSQNIDGVEQEVSYEVVKSDKSSIFVRDSRGEEFEVEDVSMRTGQAKAIEQTVKAAFINKYIGEPFKDINKFLNPSSTVIEPNSLPDLNIQC